MAPVIGAAGAIVTGAADRLAENPAGLARSVMQGFCVVAVAGAIIYGYRGYYLEKNNQVPPPAYNAGDISGFTGSPEGSKPPASNVGGASGDFTGSGREMVREALKRGSMPASWENKPSLWNLWFKESGSTPQELKFPINSSSGAFGPGQLNPSSGTSQQYGVTPNSPKIDIVVACLKYIRDRYTNPDKAWNVWKTQGWY